MAECISSSITPHDGLFSNSRRQIFSILRVVLLFFLISDTSPAFHLIDSRHTAGDFKMTFNSLLFSAFRVRHLDKEGPQVPLGFLLVLWFKCTSYLVTSGSSLSDPNNHFSSSCLC